jgi:predicted nucleic acid-binding protein
MFEGRVLDLDEEVLLKWRLLVEDGRKSGHTFAEPDLFIAATALHFGLTIVQDFVVVAKENTGPRVRAV